MVQTANLGFPRMGAKRELKKALEQYWKGNISYQDLSKTAQEIRKTNWLLQKEAGIDYIPSNDFSFYDQILDLSTSVGAIPERYNFNGTEIDPETYFAMARGLQKDGKDVVAMEMTKWFDTNYHYIVPEFSEKTNFKLTSKKIFNEFAEAQELGITTRPVIAGPITYLLSGKARSEGFDKLSLLPSLLEVYKEILQKLASQGAKSVQIDEPCLALDLDDATKAAYKTALSELNNASDLEIFLTTYFCGLRDNLEFTLSLPFNGLHIDLVREETQLEAVLKNFPKGRKLSIGVIDGRNIWKADLEKCLNIYAKANAVVADEDLIVAPSCSLLHSPVDLDNETELNPEIKNWLAFAKQKLAELSVLKKAINEGTDAVSSELAANKQANDSRKTSKLIHNNAVKQRCAEVTAEMHERENVFAERIKKQQDSLNLPLLPTTTIGSFPQTMELRAVRARFKKGEVSAAEYDEYLKKEIAHAIAFQDEIGLDVPVHGEAERNDMVEYFGEQLDGFAFTKFGWVQSYGSRCVKPPIIYGDVARPKAMTVDWTAYADSLTEKPVKGMLTGPITILQWSFVRNDQARSETCKQIALAIRDEVCDLEKAGIKIIQIDEPAIREGLPLRNSDKAAYLKWAVDAFKLSAAGVADDTQIHTHMCYSEFNDIIDSIAALDADVISIETSRSAMELLDAFVQFNYPNHIGPGVYDIHSPRVPAAKEMKYLLNKALEVLSPEQIWVNPDCGLKTRGWPETKDALVEMVNATKELRAELNK